MTTFLTIIHVLICFVLIGVVLLQSGREGGGDIGGGGGGGAKPQQSANVFMERLTSTVAVFFMITSILLAAGGTRSVMGSVDAAPAAVEPQKPSTPAGLEGSSDAPVVKEEVAPDAKAAADAEKAADEN